jgi:DNA-binding transcriptional ArsR family regulator
VANYSAGLDEVFGALSDRTRRGVIGTLASGPASVTELARSTSMTLPSFMKHVDTLERCGLIRTTKSGRVRTCTLNRKRLEVIGDWLAEQRSVWERRTDRLERFVTESKET